MLAIRGLTESLHMITSHCLAQAQAHQHGQNQLHSLLLKHAGNIKYNISKCFLAKRNVLKSCYEPHKWFYSRDYKRNCGSSRSHGTVAWLKLYRNQVNDILYLVQQYSSIKYILAISTNANFSSQSTGYPCAQNILIALNCVLVQNSSYESAKLEER